MYFSPGSGGTRSQQRENGSLNRREEGIVVMPIRSRFELSAICAQEKGPTDKRSSQRELKCPIIRSFCSKAAHSPQLYDEAECWSD